MNPRHLRLLRACLGISQEEMGRLLCLSQDRISLIESGQLQPHPRTMQLLRYLLQDPRIQLWLEESGFPHPWPGEGEPDLITVVFGPKSEHCSSCGIVLNPATAGDQNNGRLCSRCREELATKKGRRN